MNIPVLNTANKLSYTKLFARLRKNRSSEDDRLFAETHDAVFDNINCLECANCCKTHSPLFNQKDIERIAAHLNLKPAVFMSEYLLLDEDGDWIFHQTPCPFLAADNRCSIYNVRPQACREYPHTNRKKMYQIAELTITNAGICPAVSLILDEVALKMNAS